MILDSILAHKKVEVAEAKDNMPAGGLMDVIERAGPAADFIGAISSGPEGRNRIIAEVKKASPSKGVLREHFDHLAIARSYECRGAAAISVLTDVRFFKGSGAYLREIKQAVALPVLRKDFIIDAYQIYESRALEADALLLIAAVLGPGQLHDLMGLTAELGMQALVEVHTAAELERALQAGARCIGINNRSLDTFDIDINVTLDLIKSIPADIPVVSESGIHTPGHIQALKHSGVAAFLIGEALMRAPDPGEMLAALVIA